MRNVILNPEEIGIRIKVARKKMGIPQNEFAESIGKSVRTLQKYETGEINMPIDVLNTIATKLEIPIAELISEEQPGVDIDTFADIFSALFALDEDRGIELEIEMVRTKDNREVLAAYCDPSKYEFENNRLVADFLKEYLFYRESRRNGSIPDEIYTSWVKKALIAAEEYPIRSK